MEIPQYLETLRQAYLENPSGYSLPNESTVQVGGKSYNQNIWQDQSADAALVVFELSTNGLLVSKRFCLGVKYNAEGSQELLSNEQLWEIGIP
jgi:hypothetical protein|tara:strand:+ start:433 stop:711 length:279 start_codon:yes stop_codon:yes gene_type:complete